MPAPDPSTLHETLLALEQAGAIDETIRTEILRRFGRAREGRGDRERLDLEFARGDRIGDYVIEELLGAGGMGRVYRARDVNLDRALALKVLRTGGSATDEEKIRFQREARSAAKLRHPGIVTIHGFGIDRGFAYFTMDLIDGPTLDHRLDDGPLPVEEAVRIAGAIARAVDYAHQSGVLHRDLKPSNVLLAGEVPKLMDFGLARATSDEDATRLTQSGMILGTPAYMAPEQAAGRVDAIDARTDVYGLGVLLYEMLSGELPFGGDSPMAVVHRILHDDPAPPSRHRPEVDREAEAICLKAMARRPEDRYDTAGELADDLRRHAQGQETIARPLGLAGRVRKFYRRHRLACWAGAVLLAVNAAYVAGLQAALSRSRQLSAELADRNVELERRDRQRSALDLAAKASREGDPAVAAARFAEARELAPEPFEVLKLEAAYHQRHGRFDEAIAAYAQVLRLGLESGLDDETIAIVLFDLYWCHADRRPTFPLSNTEEMKAILARLAELAPDDPLVLFARSHLEDDLEAKLALLDRAIAGSDVPFWQARGLRGQFLVLAGRNEEALADLDEAIRLAPPDPLLLGFRGWLHLYRLDAPRAFEDFDEAVSRLQGRGGLSTYLLLGRGLAATLLDRHERAAEDVFVAGEDWRMVRQLLEFPVAQNPQVANAAIAAINLKLLGRPDLAHLWALRGLFLAIQAPTLEDKARNAALERAEADLVRAAELSERFGEIAGPYLAAVRATLRK